MRALKIVLAVIAATIVLDLFILAATILQIEAGEATPHIPFWDVQIHLVERIIK